MAKEKPSRKVHKLRAGAFGNINLASWLAQFQAWCPTLLDSSSVVRLFVKCYEYLALTMAICAGTEAAGDNAMYEGLSCRCFAARDMTRFRSPHAPSSGKPYAKPLLLPSSRCGMIRSIAQACVYLSWKSLRSILVCSAACATKCLCRSMCCRKCFV